MSDIRTRPRPRTAIRAERPRLYKVILLNDDFTPREFVVRILKAEFGMSEDQAHRVMITAHRRGVCVVAVFTREIAETKAERATEGRPAGGIPAALHHRAGGIDPEMIRKGRDGPAIGAFAHVCGLGCDRFDILYITP